MKLKHWTIPIRITPLGAVQSAHEKVPTNDTHARSRTADGRARVTTPMITRRPHRSVSIRWMPCCDFS